MATILHTPKNKMVITEMFAFVSVDSDGNEGVCAFQVDGVWMPLIAADRARVESLRQCAKDIAAKAQMKLRLVRFIEREEMEVIEP